MNSNLIKYENNDKLQKDNLQVENNNTESVKLNDLSLYSNIDKPDLPNLQ